MLAAMNALGPSRSYSPHPVMTSPSSMRPDKRQPSECCVIRKFSGMYSPRTPLLLPQSSTPRPWRIDAVRGASTPSGWGPEADRRRKPLTSWATERSRDRAEQQRKNKRSQRCLRERPIGSERLLEDRQTRHQSRRQRRLARSVRIDASGATITLRHY
jgi:hypothetical protein